MRIAIWIFNMLDHKKAQVHTTVKKGGNLARQIWLRRNLSIENEKTNVGVGPTRIKTSNTTTTEKRTNQFGLVCFVVRKEVKSRSNIAFAFIEIEPHSLLFSSLLFTFLSLGWRREVRKRRMMDYVTNHRFKRWKRNHRIWGATATFLCCMCLFLFTPTIPRSPNQHQFADVRNLLGNHLTYFFVLRIIFCSVWLLLHDIYRFQQEYPTHWTWCQISHF